MDSIFRRRENEERLEKEGRLPPGQSLTQKFPVLHYGPVPNFNPATWDFRVWGEVEQETRWTWDEFQKLPRTRLMMDIHCVTRWSKFDTIWEGVSVRTLIEQGLIKPKPSAKYVMQHAEYGFTVNLPLEVVLQDNFLLATHFNGAADHTRSWLPAARRGRAYHRAGRLEDALFLERRQMAARAGIHDRRSAGFLGAGRLS